MICAKWVASVSANKVFQVVIFFDKQWFLLFSLVIYLLVIYLLVIYSCYLVKKSILSELIVKE